MENKTKDNITYETQKVYSIFDAKSELYCKPLFVQTVGQITRTFSDIANDKNHPIGQHPEDYFLYQIGEYDDRKGMLINLDNPISLGKALDYVKKID